MSEPRYEMTIDFGGHGLRTIRTLTWRMVRGHITEALDREDSPRYVEITVKRDLSGSNG